MRELLNNVNQALKEVEDFCSQNKDFSDDWTIKDIKKVLTLFKEELTKEENVDIRLLRAVKDIYVVSFRNFNDTGIHRSIENLDDKLRTLFRHYEKLEALGMDFGKGNPI